jgi:UDP-N-acetylglucosamine--N-acetylmuramyl-(pentapeptide) pyrophosphoryl-undecaprenol N-acetylglucosamine transferase
LGLETTKTTLLVFGGSQGAQALNRQVPRALARAAKTSSEAFQVLHLSGLRELEEVRSAYTGTGLKAEVRAFLEEMEAAYAAADLVICRAGASTIAELLAQHRPALLIPYPESTAGHQMENARFLERAGAARALPEGEAEDRLAELLGNLLFSPLSRSRLLSMTQSYDKIHLPPPQESARLLAEAIERLVQKSP